MQFLTPCCICNDSKSRLVFPSTLRPDAGWFDGFDPYSGHYQVNKCEGCGLLYSSPIFDDVDIQSLYSGYKEANVTSSELANVRQTMAGYFRLASPYVHDRERILDIGCDIGLLLEIARNGGFKELYGLEPVAVAKAEAAKRVPGADITAHFYEEGLFKNEFFDLISLVHVVDHLVRPEQTLSLVWRQLKPGGVCIAVVHNVESVIAMLLGERFPVFNFFHHYFFTKQTLRRLFESRGFEPVRVAATRNCYSLSFFLERLPFLSIGLRSNLAKLAHHILIGRIPLSIPLGNIAIVARKPRSSPRIR
jgi:SAM-dependent methyltransferase